MPNQARMKSRGGLATAALVLVIMSSQLQMTWADLVIINAQKDSGADQLKLCAMRRDLASPGKDGKTFPLVYLNRTDGACHELDPVSAHSITDRATFLWIRGQPQCSLAQIASNVEPNDPAMVIIGTNGPLSINKTLVNLSLPYIFMPDEYAQRLSKFLSGANDPTVYLEADTSKFDASLMVIWLIAVATVILGSLWTLHEFRVMSETSRQQHEEQLRQHQQQQLQLQQPKTMSSDEDLIGAETQENNTTNKPQVTSINNNQDTTAKNIAANNNNPHKNPITIHIGYVSILVLLVIVVAMILLLYFFYNVMIYFVFFIFCVGSASAFYRIGCLFLSNKPLKTPIPTAKSKIFSIDLRKLFIALVSIAICIVWFVYRHQSWSWIIQDMMAFSLAVNALSYYRISTYKTVALILSLFFAYDVFMVFITPAFTKGTSIMEAVAFGGRDVTNSAVNDWNNIQFGTRVDTTNKLPVVIIIPHLGAFKRLCAYYYDYSVSLLGLGDILIPGLSTNYAIIYDYAKHGRASVYFFVNVIAYFLGLFLAFVALILMNTAQPALFYLCPVLIICSLITSLVRREFRSFWGGEPIHKLVASLHPETLGDEAINHDSVNGNNNNGNQSSLSADEQEQENETKHHISGRNTLKKNESTKAILSEIDSA